MLARGMYKQIVRVAWKSVNLTKLDKYRAGYCDKINAVKNQCRLIEKNEDVPCDKSWKITIDNLDYKPNVHHMSEQHQNIDFHLFQSCQGALEFNDEKNDLGIMVLENGRFIPSDSDNLLHRSNDIALVGQMLVDSIP